MIPRFPLFSLLALLLAAGSLSASGSVAQRRSMTDAELEAFSAKVHAACQMTGPSAYLDIVDSGHFDERGVPYVRAHRSLDGVRIWGSDFIMKDEGRGMTLASGDGVETAWRIDTKPVLNAEQALAIAKTSPNASTFLAEPPTVELVIYPIVSQKPMAAFRALANEDLRAEHMEEVIDDVKLAYHVNAMTRTVIVDAKTGAVIEEWSALFSAEEATLNTQWCGVKTGGTTKSGSKYILKDPVRNFNVLDLAFKSSGNGSTVEDYNNDNKWGDGKQLTGKSAAKKSDNYQTSLADLYYGTQVTYDYFVNIHNFKGYDGRGTMPTVNGHLGDSSGNPYDNAFSSGSALTFGDGYKRFFALTTVDIVAHEFGHSFCNSTSKYVYKGESGGINEANSDIVGTLVEFYQSGADAKGKVVPDTGGDYLIAGKICKPSGTPMRWMAKPSRDGKSPDYWTSSANSVEVHAGSGVGNKAFYHMSVGGQGSDSSKDDYSKCMNVNKAGWVGIGNDKAARIHFKAIVDYGRSGDNYKKNRENELKAAKELYGETSREYKVAYTAWAAVAVGASDDVKVPEKEK